MTFLQDLDVEALLRILTEPKNALVKQYRQLFAFQGKQLDVTPGALQFIAEDAVRRKTGARSLRSVLESTLHKTMFEMPSRDGMQGCVIDVETDSDDKQSLVVRYIDQVLATDNEPPQQDASLSLS